MNVKNLKIGTQLKLGFAIMLFFVIILGIRSYFQSDQIHQQIDIMYNHPLKVQRALGGLKSDILSIHRDMKDLFLATDEKDITVEQDWIKWWRMEAAKHIDTLYSQYLGPRADIDSIEKAFIDLNSVCDETDRLMRSGQNREVYNRTKTFGIVGSKVEILLGKLKKVDKFSVNKSEELYHNSEELRVSLNNQLIAMVAVIVMLSLLIHYFLLRNIHRPLSEMISATRRFQNGDIARRSSYTSRNEFGILSDSFNTLADSIQKNMELNEKTTNLAGLMVSENDANKFFHTTLSALSAYTGSQMAAAYLLSEDKKTFEHFESIGIDENAKQSFAAGSFEGEFGSALSLRKIQHIQNIPENTRFIFQTVSGKFIPREIITIPILAGNEVIAIISLASINIYSEQSDLLIEKILDTISARVEWILAYRKIKEFSIKLELQNRELEARKAELGLQSKELMKQNAELEIQKKQLDEANRLKTNFLSNMSHELRTPLNSIIALSGVLNRRLANQIPEEEYSYLDVIERNGKKLLSLINDILDISRIESGREEIEITDFNVCDLVADVLKLIQPQAKQKNIELVQSENDTDLFITSDIDKCHHILQNIIGNAVKFTEKGKVEVSARQSDHGISITVSDTGIGIAEKHLSQIFDEFRQADSSTSRRFGGTGLGLALAKKYAGLLGGTISVKSKIDKGSEFTLTLPLRYVPENRINEAVKPQEELSAIKGKEVVLVVEDNPDNMLATRTLLTGSYIVIEAIDGFKGVEMAKKHKPNLILMDIELPGMDGIEAFKAIRRDAELPHIPVIALTASAMSQERETILAHGFDAYIIKPINEQQFFKTIDEILYGK